jgi:HAD superfamily hydrolase (TIGR01509 family)
VVLSNYLAASSASTEDPLTFRRYVRLTLDQLGIALDEATLDHAFAALCREHRRENFFGLPAPGVLETLEQLAKHYKLAVVSNAGGKVAIKLREAGFDRHLLAVMDSGLVGIEKPDPRIFLMACEHAKVRPERSLYVGDLHAIDVVGARRAGLRPVLLDPEGAYAAMGVTDVPLCRDVPGLPARIGDGF